jgi:hypothetical protein
MAALWWIGMGGIALAVMTVLYFVWWLIGKLFAPRTRNHTVVYLKTHKGLVRKEY